MELTAELEAPVAPEALFAAVDELDRYPAWLELVPRAERVEAGPGDPRPAWSVDLRGRVGSLARSKRLRMVRTVHDTDPSGEGGRQVRFERIELDGRRHSPWVLSAAVGSVGEHASILTMRLHYGGALFGPVLERILVDEIERSKPRLLALVAET